MKWISRNEYLAIHAWLRYKFGSAKKCENENCKNRSSIFHWALKKGCSYERNVENFIPLCHLCHIEYDEKEPEKLHTFRDKKCMNKIQEAKFKEINQYSLNGDFVRKWKSATHASESLKISRTSINNNLYNRSKTSGGYIWKLNG